MSIELIVVAIAVVLIFVIKFMNKAPQTNDNTGEAYSPSRLRQLTDRFNSNWIITTVLILIVVGVIYFFWADFANWFSGWLASSWVGSKTNLTQGFVRNHLWIATTIFALVVIPVIWGYTRKDKDGKRLPFNLFAIVGDLIFGFVALILGSAVLLGIIAAVLLVLGIVADMFGLFDSVENLLRTTKGEVTCTSQDDLSSISKKGGFYETKTLNICPIRGKLHFWGDKKVVFRISPDFVKKYNLKGSQDKIIANFMKVTCSGNKAYYIEPLPLESNGRYISMYDRLGIDSVPLDVIPYWNDTSPKKVPQSQAP